MKLSTEDREDLMKYIRYFALKAAQIIVSSRMGLKESTKSIPTRGKSDWFNLNISQIPELLASLKTSITNNINSGCPVCVEIILITSEGYTMVLETWSISLLPERSDPAPKITHTVYNQMGILLKSLLSVTRVTPAYKLSQRQSPDSGIDSFMIYYRLYEKEPEYLALGEGFKQVRIGQICTPVGTLKLNVAYRCDLTIAPTQSSTQDSSLLLKSDHFNTNLCPKTNKTHRGDDKSRRKGQTTKAAFASPRTQRIKEPIDAFKPGGVLWNPKLYYAIVEGQEPTTKTTTTEAGNKKEETKAKKDGENVKNVANSPKEEERKRTYSTNSEELTSSDRSSNENCSLSRVAKPCLILPFAAATPGAELMKFFKGFKDKRRSLVSSTTSSIGDINDLSEQLSAFEMKAKEYDELVKDLCGSPDSDN